MTMTRRSPLRAIATQGTARPRRASKHHSLQAEQRTVAEVHGLPVKVAPGKRLHRWMRATSERVAPPHRQLAQTALLGRGGNSWGTTSRL